MTLEDTRVYFEVKEKKHRESVRKVSKAEQVQEDIEKPCFLFIDQATSSGYALYDNKNQLILSGRTLKGRSSLEAYKFGFKDIIYALIDEYEIKTIFHEEVYDRENMWTTEVLLYIKHMIQDIAYLREGVEVYGLDHMTWKTKLASPDKFNTKNNHKAEIKKYVEGVYPLIFMDKESGKITEDMVDAIGMGVAVLVKQTRRGSFYHTVRYNKNLPVDIKIMVREGETWEEKIGRCRKPYRDGYAVGGFTEIELDRRRGTGDLFRRFLTHRDGVVGVHIPKDYKDWGVLLLDFNIKPSSLGGEQDFWLVGVRRRRKR